jgi:hypothetical protein
MNRITKITVGTSYTYIRVSIQRNENSVNFYLDNSFDTRMRANELINTLLDKGRIKAIKHDLYPNGWMDITYAPVEPVESFPVASLSREDLETRGFDTSHVSDALMSKLAETLGDSFVGYGEYWEALDYAAERYGIPRDPDWDENNDENYD